MNILLGFEKFELSDLLGFTLEGSLKAKTFVFNNSNSLEAVQKQITTIDAAIVEYSDQPSSPLQSLIKAKSSIPTIIIVPPKFKPEGVALKKVLGFVEQPNTINESISILEKLQKKSEAASSSKAIPAESSLQISTDASLYCRIKTELLLRVSPLKAAVFIRLSDEKFIKLFNEGASFEGEDLEKYLGQKKIQYLYLRNSDTKEFLEKFKADLLALLESPVNPTTDKSISEISEPVFETVQELIGKMGPTPEVQEIVKANINLAIRDMKKAPKLSNILDKLTRDKTKYISSHSFMLGHLSCTISAAMKYNSDTTYYKLTMAAMLHDIVLNNNDLAIIQSITDLETKKAQFTEEEITAFKQHPITASELAKSFAEVPPDVDVIILQHHENPDGSGFPRGLLATRISPLASIFIVAHDLLLFILKHEKNPPISAFIKANEEKYSSGNFKKILKALAELSF